MMAMELIREIGFGGMAIWGHIWTAPSECGDEDEQVIPCGTDSWGLTSSIGAWP